MLVLAYPYRFGINFHQLGQWILQAAGDRYSTALFHLEIRKFFPGKV
ncbi:Uncharacterised protein [Mycobacteroides abscessus subsp. abscessus]|nr:Uncharacterised protein [Mycobacteroides abscessus subsp. abscessus]